MNAFLRILRLAVALVVLGWLACAPARAAITEIAATTAQSANASATALSVNVPSGTVAGDVMLAQITSSKNTATLTAPAGWTAIRSDNLTYLTVGVVQRLFYRVATAGEPASYSFGASVAGAIAGTIVNFRGVDNTTPIFNHSGATGSLLLSTAPAIASCTAGMHQVGFFGFSTALLSLTLGPTGVNTYAGNTTSLGLGLTTATSGATVAAGTGCQALTALAVSVTANIGQHVALNAAIPTYTVAGSVYGDANHDSTLTAGEVGIGQTTYVKLASGSPGACTSPALQAATVDPSTGAYTFSGVLAGSYCVIASTNATLTDVTATMPTGFVRTETSTGVRAATVSAANLTGQNFGLYAGSTLAGRAFTDNGAGGGTANDGVINGTEAGITGLAVAASSGATTIASATTDATGAYTLWLPSSSTGSIVVTETPASGSLAISGNVGTTAGTYARATNATTFTVAAGSQYTGVNFGNVPANTLSTTGATSAPPDATVPYAHSFVAGTAGSVTFSTAATAGTWTQSIILDANCNGVVDSGEAAVSGAIAVTAGQTVCIVVRDTMPAGAANGAQDVVTVTATMAYANASPAFSQSQTRTDTTTVSTSLLMQVAKQVRNVTQNTSFATSNGAKPNEVLEYQLVVTNPSAGGVTTMTVNDATPGYTTFVSASCPGSLPSGVTACAVPTKPAAGATGAVQWTFTGTLAAAGSITVTFQVRVDQ